MAELSAIRAFNKPEWTSNDIDDLIKIVQNYPALFNPCHPLYHNRKHTTRIWSELDYQFKRAHGSSQEQWYLLRSQFRRHCNRRIEWRHGKALSFLIPYCRIRPSNSSSSLQSCINTAIRQVISDTAEHDRPIENTATLATDNQNIEVECDEAHDAASNVTADDIDPPLLDHDSINSNSQEDVLMDVNVLVEHSRTNANQHTLHRVESSHGSRPRKRSHSHILSSRSISAVPASSTSSLSLRTQRSHGAILETLDPDTMFMLSLLPEIKSMTSNQKMSFKVKIQQFVQELLYSDD